MGLRRTYRLWLSPYAWALALRHCLYDKGILGSRSFDVPVICVGNITVGGTGKTPMTEFLVRRLLEHGKRPVVLSRGYGRKTGGFRFVQVDDSVDCTGDEPLQIKRRYPQAVVAVCEDRVEGMKRLLVSGTEDAWFILDDAFQHRRLRAGRNILMTDYRRPFMTDNLLPFGRLRDVPSAACRADCVVYTHCPSSGDPLRGVPVLQKDLPVYPTYMEYSDPQPFNDPLKRPERGSPILLVTGIANALPLKEYLQTGYQVVCQLNFRDHHRFSQKELERIRTLLGQHPQWQLVTTAKDATRLRGSGIRGWIIPVGIRFFSEDNANEFFHLVTGLR